MSDVLWNNSILVHCIGCIGCADLSFALLSVFITALSTLCQSCKAKNAFESDALQKICIFSILEKEFFHFLSLSLFMIKHSIVIKSYAIKEKVKNAKYLFIFRSTFVLLTSPFSRFKR